MANLVATALALFLTLGCAKERPVLKVLPENSRVAKSQLEGTYVFLKSIVDIQTPGENYRAYAPGMHLDSDKLVQFKTTENVLNVVAIDPLYKEESAAPQTQMLASFPVRHVDVLRKRNPDGEETHEEEETQQRRSWREREFLSIDLVHDALDTAAKETLSATLTSEVDLDPHLGAINFVVQRLLSDGTSLSVRYSFLRYRPSTSYQQRPYSLDDQVQFGLFRTTTYKLNAFDQLTESTRQEFMNLWDTSHTVVFYFGSNFPEHLKPMVRRVFKTWASTMKEAVGDSVLELRENTGQQLGDLRYNLIVYDDSEHSSHGALGFAPGVTNPRTGEILKADVFLYGRVLKRAIFQELFWQRSRQLPTGPQPVKPQAAASLWAPIRNLRQFELDDLGARITRLNEDVIREALEAAHGKLSVEDLENRIFEGVFAHEFGHVLGLRHNFLGSADSRHFEGGSRSSTIMDYGFLQGHSYGVGSYDRAAIAFAYSPDSKTREKQRSENFLFCTDEQIFTSQMPLCDMFDSSTNLQELIDNQLDRYLTDYDINNQRLERIGFGDDASTYDKRVLALLLPIRLAYDNAQAILQASGQRDFPALWTLSRQRIEADPSTTDSRAFEVLVPAGSHLELGENGPLARAKLLKRTLDRWKISRVVEDARGAREKAILALRRIILDTKRPNYDQVDGVTHHLQVRGVMKDKLLALSLIAAPTEHPLQTVANDEQPLQLGRTMSPYSASEKTVPKLFSSVLSNTVEVQDPEGGTEPYYQLHQFDMTMRKYALNLLADEVAQVGRHPEARELIRLQSVPLATKGPQQEDWQRSNTQRAEFREFYRTLMTEGLAKEVPEGEFEFSFADLSPYEQGRNLFDYSYTKLNDETLLGAPISTAVDNLKTASGLLIRNNLNVAEDYQEALSKTRDLVQDDIFKGRFALRNAVALNQLDKKRDALDRYISGEQVFLQEMYLKFTKHDSVP